MSQPLSFFVRPSALLVLTPCRRRRRTFDAREWRRCPPSPQRGKPKMRRKRLWLGLSTGKLCFVNSVRIPGRPPRLRVTCLAARGGPAVSVTWRPPGPRRPPAWPACVPDAHISRRTVIHSVLRPPASCTLTVASTADIPRSVYISASLLCRPDTAGAPPLAVNVSSARSSSTFVAISAG